MSDLIELCYSGAELGAVEPITYKSDSGSMVTRFSLKYLSLATEMKMTGISLYLVTMRWSHTGAMILKGKPFKQMSANHSLILV